MANETEGRSIVNVKRLTMWKLTSDDESTTVYEEAPRTFPHQLNAVSYTPKVNTAEQYGDGVKVENYVAKDGGTIDVTIRGFAQGDNEFLFGETTNKNNVAISNSGDIVPYNCTAYMTERPDGTVNLYKFPKVKYMPKGEDNKQREGTNISYGTASLSGTYSPLLSNGDDAYKRYGVDPKEDAAFIESWFTDADFIGNEGSV